MDSHTHLVFAGDRSAEFSARMAGTPYSTGGIHGTTEATCACDDARLRRLALKRVAAAYPSGNTSIEIKSGYGLTVYDDERLHRIAGEIARETTFLGGHVVPDEYRGRADEYVHLFVKDMLEATAPHARFVDVFCEEGAFDEDQSRAILMAGIDQGLLAKVHGNQLGPGPGVRLAVEVGAVSGRVYDGDGVLYRLGRTRHANDSR